MLVVCNGMIRAGSTLQYNLARSLVERSGVGRGEGFLLGREDGFARALAEWAQDSAHHVLKMHHIHAAVVGHVTAGRGRICYVYRDIRDVAVSAKRKWTYDEDRLLEALDHAVKVYYQLRAVEPVLWQRYEDLMRDLGPATAALAAFLGIDLPASEIEQIARECSIEAVETVADRYTAADHVVHFLNRCHARLPQRAKAILHRTGVWWLLKRGGVLRPVYDPRTLLHPDHISPSKGAIGIWRTALSAEEIRLLSTRYAAWIRDAAYELDGPRT